MRAFVDQAHALGMGVILDVVYNHLGPDHCYHHAFSQYYPHRKHPGNDWGDSLNFDGPRAGRSGSTSLPTRATGSPNTTSTVYGWTRPRPSMTTRNTTSLPRWASTPASRRANAASCFSPRTSRKTFA
jgi:glycosidase